MILVTGATGTNGRDLTRLLVERGVSVRAMVRSPHGPAPAGVDLVTGDFDDEASLDRALEGVTRAFLLTPSTERAEEQQLRFVAAAKAAGVAHIVKLSQLAADANSPVRFLRYHAAVEAAIAASGMAWTFLRPNLFMQGLLQLSGMIRDHGMFAAQIGDARVSVVDTRDNAAAAAAALTEPGHDDAIYTLTGPEALTHAEMAAALSAATGSEIRFADSSEGDMRQAMLAVGMPAWQVEGLIEDYAHYRRGEAAAVATGVKDATGREPREFDAFAHDYADDFKARPAGD